LDEGLENMELAREERNAINALKRLEKRWPETLWIFATGNGMHILKCGINGKHVMNDQGVPDLDYEVGYITGIDNDGGDF
jgi:hypothetical protein